MILHLLQDGIRLNLEFVEYDLNYNVCLVGRLEGHGLGYVVSGFVLCLTAVSLVHHIHLISRTKRVDTRGVTF